ncbi:MAG TPA: hypothetical protein PLS90_12015 [Candidatus Sumerlaeota bacterium]|nr:hypothetical protein [Candidatus Sumerlaeota bacterium]
MEYGDAAQLMRIIACATPIVALCGWIVLRGERRPDWPKTRRNLVILGLAGPVNLAGWWIFNGWLDRAGWRSVHAYIIAFIVFIVAGFATGFFSRLRRSER